MDLTLERVPSVLAEPDFFRFVARQWKRTRAEGRTSRSKETGRRFEPSSGHNRRKVGQKTCIQAALPMAHATSGAASASL